MRRAAYRGILCLGLLACGIVPAAAQMETREGIALQNQILELQREIQVLSQRGAGGAAPAYVAPYPQAAPSGASSGIVTQLLTRVDALESAMRDLRGQVEQLSNQVQQQSAQLGKRIDDLQFKVQNPQAGSSAPTPGPPPSPSASGPPPAQPPVSASPGPALPSNGRRTPELGLRSGDAALARHDYTTAEKDAREVLANRASPRAYDAQYLLAQALMGQRQYSQAAIAFDDAYNRQKKGVHAPDALLGLADSLIAINEKRAACDTLTKLRTEFPSARADLRDRAAQMGKRAGCR